MKTDPFRARFFTSILLRGLGSRPPIYNDRREKNP